MQGISNRRSSRLTDEERETIAAWRNGVIAFYGILFIIICVVLVVETHVSAFLADQGGQISRLTVSANK